MSTQEKLAFLNQRIAERLAAIAESEKRQQVLALESRYLSSKIAADRIAYKQGA